VGLRQLIIDVWSSLNYKPVFSNERGMPNRRVFPEAAAMWVPAADERRLAAYKLLTAYDNNQVAELNDILRPDGWDAREAREFGDPAKMIETLLASVLGREQHIVVPDAEQDPDDPDGDGGQAAVTASDIEAARRVQEGLDGWAQDELLPMRMVQCERETIVLGDGVYHLWWDPAKRRPRLSVYDPGLYFPVIGEDSDGGDYPTRVHLAWELPEDKQRGLERRVRRITFELGYIGPATASGVDRDGRPQRVAVLADPDPDSDDTPPPLLTAGDVVGPDGTITRQYAWNDAPSPYTCYLTDATWNLSDLRGPVDVDTLPLSKAAFATREDGEVLDRLDLMIDMIPVVHVPNTVPAPGEHWGTSSLAKVLQVFDELAGTDTDSAKASATTGSPIIALSGKSTASKEYVVGPGEAFHLGEGGRMDTLDTSPQLQELRARTKELQDRAASNARLPAVTMGTADPAKYPSGYALELALGPLDSLVAFMRLARDHKYRLLLKFVHRLFLAGQHPDWAGTRPHDARVVFGPYTPTDRQGVLTMVTDGVAGGVLSLETGVQMLKDAGFPIEDITVEIERIQSRRFADAKQLADATGNPQAVGDYLGLDLEPGQQPPTPKFPPVPGDTDPQNDPGQTPPGAGQPPTGGSTN
jgi:hypothetical protein